MKNIIQQFKSLFKSKAQIEKERAELARIAQEEKEELTRREQEKKERAELARIEREEKERISRQPKFCKHCDKLVLSQSEFIKKCRAAGLLVDFLGNLNGGSNYMYRQLEDSKGFLCRSCGSVYCMACLLSIAPMGTHGGKACPACGGQFQLLD